MTDPKLPTITDQMVKVYKTFQEIQKLLEQEIGISVCWVSFSLKNKEMSI